MGCPETIESEVEKQQNIANINPDLLYVYDDISWLWKWGYTKPDGTSFRTVEVPYRPTTWVVSAITLNKEKGIAISEEPFRVCKIV